MDQGKDPQPTVDAYSRAPSARVKGLVNYDEKRHLADIQEDIDHGVARQETLPVFEEPVDGDDLSESWESGSVFEDMYEELFEDRYFTDGQLLQEDALLHVFMPFSFRFIFLFIFWVLRPFFFLHTLLRLACYSPLRHLSAILKPPKHLPTHPRCHFFCASTGERKLTQLHSR
jgi:hypothetical protein